MPDLPSGTVTFLSSDIEGSTHLLQRLRRQYAVVLAEYQALLRACWSACGGTEVDSTGDAFFVAFATAPQAVAAAAQAITALAAHPWPERGEVRVRIGLHTGAPQLVGDHYVGLDVHRAARIAAAGHGGQILLSQATRELIEYDLPEGTALRDLGPHRLKDLQRAEHLWQLVLPDLPTDFPPLKTLDRHIHNLPTQPTRLLDREQAVSTLNGLLRHEETGDGETVRLVTLTGPGGIGKTRLALQVAAEVVDAFADGVWFVRLSRLSDPALVVPSIASTLGVKEAGEYPIADALRAYLHEKRLLLLLDNFEQVVGAAMTMADLLAEHAGLRVLVTSRIPLHVRGEHEIPVPPLGVPPPVDAKHPYAPEQLSPYASVALFLERAQAVKPDFTITTANAPAVAAICAQVDGLPLALELAAARVKLLSPPALLSRLKKRLAVLTGGARDLDERQQTLRSTIAWSEDLLDPEQQRLFRRLAVFVGGAALEGVEAVCLAPEGAEPLAGDALERLATLVDQSLVQQREEGDEPRFGMLQTIREYALDRLEASADGEATAVRQAHLGYFLALAEQAAPQLRSLEQRAWLDRLERDLDNLRAALAWAREHGDLECGLRLATALGQFCLRRGYVSEGRAWLERMLNLAETGGATSTQGMAPIPTAATAPEPVAARVHLRALYHAGHLALRQGDGADARARFEDALERARAAGDWRMELRVTNGLGVLARGQGDLDRAERRYNECLALARDHEASPGVALALLGLGDLGYLRGNWAQAVARTEESLALFREQNDRENEGVALANLSQSLLRQGDLAQAVALGREAATVFRAIGEPLPTAFALEKLAMAAAVASRPAEEADLAARERQAERAARLVGAAAALRETIGTPQPAVEAADLEPVLAPARALLGEERWQAALAAGRLLSYDGAVAEALGE